MGWLEQEQQEHSKAGMLQMIDCLCRQASDSQTHVALGYEDDNWKLERDFCNVLLACFCLLLSYAIGSHQSSW